jgi:hypothetical protein
MMNDCFCERQRTRSAILSSRSPYFLLHEEVCKPSVDQLKGRTLTRCNYTSPYNLWVSVGSVKYNRLGISEKHNVLFRQSWLAFPHGTVPVVANAAGISVFPAVTEGRSLAGDEQEALKQTGMQCAQSRRWKSGDEPERVSSPLTEGAYPE